MTADLEPLELSKHGPVDRGKLLKGIPDSIPNLFAQFALTATSEQDQLLITSLDIELKAAGLDWQDLANLLRYQMVAHRRATMAGVINAAKAHPNRHRLSEWETKFLGDVGRRNRLLTDKQLSCLQSITDSLNMSDDDYALHVLARGEYGEAA